MSVTPEKAAEVAIEAAEYSSGAEIDPDARIETESTSSETVTESEIDPDARVESNGAEVDNSRIDDNGNVYKDENGELLPNTEYEVNGTRYTTDERGRIIQAEGYLEDTPENERDNAAQSDAGGKDRKPGDDGGHLRARMNGGSSGNENLVAMRATINRGDYKQSENEENQMLKEGKQVYEKIEVTYDDDSARPSKIDKTYTDGEKTVKLTELRVRFRIKTYQISKMKLPICRLTAMRLASHRFVGSMIAKET